MDKYGQILIGIYVDFSVDFLCQFYVFVEDEGVIYLCFFGDIQVQILLLGVVVLEIVYGVSVYDKFYVYVVFFRFIEDDSLFVC